jgi:hypothetical protein
VWEAVHHTLLNWLGLLDAIRGERASLDSTSVRAKRGGEATGPNPTDSEYGAAACSCAA